MNLTADHPNFPEWYEQLTHVCPDLKTYDERLDAEFMRRIERIGVPFEQADAWLVNLRLTRRAGDRFLQPGDVPTRLRELIHDNGEPRRDYAEPVEKASGFGVLASAGSPLHLYARDPDAALEAYPWLHKPHGGYARRVDHPLMRHVIDSVREAAR